MKQAKQKKYFYNRVFARRKMLKDIRQEATAIFGNYYGHPYFVVDTDLAGNTGSRSSALLLYPHMMMIAM